MTDAKRAIPAEYERFKTLTKKLLSVPKKDVDRKEQQRVKNGRKRKTS